MLFEQVKRRAHGVHLSEVGLVQMNRNFLPPSDVRSPERMEAESWEIAAAGPYMKSQTTRPSRRKFWAKELIMAIGEYVDRHNDNPKPFVWTAKASDILEKIKRARKALDIG